MDEVVDGGLGTCRHMRRFDRLTSMSLCRWGAGTRQLQLLLFEAFVANNGRPFTFTMLHWLWRFASLNVVFCFLSRAAEAGDFCGSYGADIAFSITGSSMVGDDDVFVVGGIACLQRASKMYSYGCLYIQSYVYVYTYMYGMSVDIHIHIYLCTYLHIFGKWELVLLAYSAPLLTSLVFR